MAIRVLGTKILETLNLILYLLWYYEKKQFFSFLAEMILMLMLSRISNVNVLAILFYICFYRKNDAIDKIESD